MVQSTNQVVRKVYYQMSTTNKSFLDTYHYLKDRGIKNNRFFLVLTDPDLAGIDPRDPRLNTFMKQKVLRECVVNYIGPVIGAHSGYKTLAVFCVGENRGAARMKN